MKKIYIFHTIYLVLLCSISGIYAQVSQGGAPPSHSPYFKQVLASKNGLQTLQLTSPDLTTLRIKQEKLSGLAQFSESIPVNLNLTNSGKWTELDNGDRIWRLKISSKGAKSLHNYYENFWLPEGALFFVYSEDENQILGAYNSTNNQQSRKFATSPIYGSSFILEYYEPYAVKGQGTIQISSVEYGLIGSTAFDDTKAFGDSEPCNVNINCPEGDDWQVEKRSVATILSRFTDVGGSFLCSGGLINNSNNDARPLFLSAFHCQDVGTPDYDAWIFTFNFEGNACENPPAAPNSSQTILGCKEIVRGSPSDYLLLELNESVPLSYNPYFAGWNNTGENPTVATAIHHPAGDIKKISQSRGTVTPNADFLDIPSISIFSPNTQWVMNWAFGDTEGGSSGSPLFDQDGYVIGQLTGGSVVNCTPNSFSSYGRLIINWESAIFREALDPVQTGQTRLNGYDPAQELTNLVVTRVETAVASCDFSSSTPIEIKVRNSGDTPQQNFDISYKIQDAQGSIIDSSGFTITEMLAADSTATITFNADFSQNGTYQVTAQSILAGDQHAGDDMLMVNLTNDLPTTGASNLTFDQNTGQFIGISWQPGNGSQRMVLMKEGSDFTASDLPSDGVEYQANDLFGQGTAIGSAYPVYIGSENSATVQNLTEGQTYFIAVIEFSCDPPDYLTEDLGSVTNIISNVEESQNQFSSFEVFPNPAQDQLNININSFTSDRARVEFISPLGKLIDAKELRRDHLGLKTVLNTEGLNPGVYFLRVATGAKNTTYQIIIK